MKKKIVKKIEKKNVEKPMTEEEIRKFESEFNEKEPDVYLSIGTGAYGDEDVDGDALMTCSDDDTWCIDNAIKIWKEKLLAAGIRTIEIRYGDNYEIVEERKL
jgi:hypothetical protein